MKRRKKVVLIVLGMIVVAIAGTIGYSSYYDSRHILYLHEAMIQSSQIECHIDHMSSYDTMPYKSSSLDNVSVSGDEIQKSPIQYTFKNLESTDIDALSSDSTGIDQFSLTKVVDTSDVIQMVGIAGFDQDIVTVYTIYRKSGLFTYTRSGEILSTMQSVGMSVGHCD